MSPDSVVTCLTFTCCQCVDRLNFRLNSLAMGSAVCSAQSDILFVRIAQHSTSPASFATSCSSCFFSVL
eukprot:1506955-Amphidinium_carterae.1